MTDFEENETNTILNFQIGIKLIVLRFFNTVIIPILVNLDIKKWFDSLTTTLFFIFFAVPFWDGVFLLFNTKFITKKYR